MVFAGHLSDKIFQTLYWSTSFCYIWLCRVAERKHARETLHQEQITSFLYHFQNFFLDQDESFTCTFPGEAGPFVLESGGKPFSPPWTPGTTLPRSLLEGSEKDFSVGTACMWAGLPSPCWWALCLLSGSPHLSEAAQLWFSKEMPLIKIGRVLVAAAQTQL